MARQMSLKRIVGLDRSGPPDRRTLSDQPWRPWTIPNAIGYLRLLLVPVFLWFALRSPDGRDVTANVAMLVCGVSDYFDGLAARLTGQYSRLGTLLDPFVDRLLIIAAAIVIYKFELLPRYLISLVFLREALMLLVAVPALRKGVELQVNWIGRLAVWPLMGGGYLALVSDSVVAEVLVWIGVIGAWSASVLYLKSAWPVLRGSAAETPAQDLNQS